MHEPALLRELVVIFTAALAVVVLLSRLHLPTIAGFVLAGALLGPSGLGWVEDHAGIEQLAEVGVGLLLFTVGLEFSLRELGRLRRALLLGGGLQVGLTTGFVSALGVAAGLGPPKAVFLGFLVALSSTAIVMKGLAERGEADAPHGRLIVGVLLFQDLCVVPMMLVVPMLAGRGQSPVTLPRALLTALLVVAGTLLLARPVVPRAMRLVAKTGRRDLFVLSVVAVCAGIGWLTALAGLSLALGAFLAGVVLADSEFGHQALSDVLPLRDIFTSLFFVSMGMLFDARVLAGEPGRVLGLLAALMVGKAALVVLAALLARFPMRLALLAGVALSQVGEFSFLLASIGAGMGLLAERELGLFMAASVLSMLVAPFALRLGPTLVAAAARVKGSGRFEALDAAAISALPLALRDHVVVLGFGLGGAMLAEALRAAGVAHAVVDIDAERVRSAGLRGEPVLYGDVTSPEILERVNLNVARNVAVMLNDPDATLRAVRAARRIAPQARIVVRARYVGDTPSLLAAGASEIVAQEFEASLEVIERVIQGAARQAARGVEPTGARLPPGVEVESLVVPPGAWIAGRSLAEAELRARTGATLLALSRGETTAVHPTPADALAAGDVLCLVGATEQIAAARRLIESGPAAWSGSQPNDRGRLPRDSEESA